MPARLAQEELQRIGRGLDRGSDRSDDLRVWDGALDDLDRPLIELPEQRVLLELRQLVGLGDLNRLGNLISTKAADQEGDFSPLPLDTAGDTRESAT